MKKELIELGLEKLAEEEEEVMPAALPAGIVGGGLMAGSMKGVLSRLKERSEPLQEAKRKLNNSKIRANQNLAQAEMDQRAANKLFKDYKDIKAGQSNRLPIGLGTASGGVMGAGLGYDIGRKLDPDSKKGRVAGAALGAGAGGYLGNQIVGKLLRR